ncbi:MAG: putative baseplate assembly protein, partial [Cyanobacteria bacterium P01_A01_bin.105]
SPRLLAVAARSVGGTIDASQCRRVLNEVLGESNGQPGQTFQLQSVPVLARDATEQLIVLQPNGAQQTWQEVNDFADSGPDDCHYTLDSLTGTVQFGPLIREPGQLKTATVARSHQQTNGTTLLTTAPQLMERQYGAVPARGATLTLPSYRTGGGQQGNVQPQTLRVVKSAVPYVAAITNHGPAYHGADGESLDNAVLRVPKLLRTRDRAVTPEDFETLAIEASQGAVARSICPQQINDQPGLVRVLLVPQANLNPIETAQGITPGAFDLTPQLTQQVLQYLDERRPLGIQVQLQAPSYIGVSVQTEVALDPAYGSPEAQQAILQALRVTLYRFLNPLVGGRDGHGWPFGTAVYPSDIITQLQGVRGVRYLGAVMLYELRRTANGWVRQLAPDNVVKPGPLGLVCSWADPQLRSGHAISVIN